MDLMGITLITPYGGFTCDDFSRIKQLVGAIPERTETTDCHKGEEALDEGGVFPHLSGECC